MKTSRTYFRETPRTNTGDKTMIHHTLTLTDEELTTIKAALRLLVCQRALTIAELRSMAQTFADYV